MNVMPSHSRGPWALRNAAQAYGVHQDEITGRSRTRTVCQARYAVMCALDDCGWSSVRIGKLLNRDHTTILHGLDRLTRRAPKWRDAGE
jgi:chromosomal replication initiation ATPase DnaA